MTENSFLEKLREGRILLGLANVFPAAGIVETIGRVCDFLWIDGQHGQHDYVSVLHAVRAARAAGVETIVRVPSATSGELIRYLDADPSAVMVPMVNSAAEARALVRAVHFPPLGERSYGGRRMVDLYGRSYHLQRRPAVLAQIETPRAVRAAAQIAAVEGIDMLFFGADDVKASLGLDIDATPSASAPLRRAMAATAAAARKARKAAGCVAIGEETLRLGLELGYRLFAVGSDAGLIRLQAPQLLAACRRACEKALR